VLLEVVMTVVAIVMQVMVALIVTRDELQGEVILIKDKDPEAIKPHRLLGVEIYQFRLYRRVLEIVEQDRLVRRGKEAVEAHQGHHGSLALEEGLEVVRQDRLVVEEVALAVAHLGFLGVVVDLGLLEEVVVDHHGPLVLL